MHISTTERKQIIAEYSKAWRNFSDIYTALTFLSKITDADCVQTLELNADQRSGLSVLLAILAKHFSENLYDGLPVPEDFSKLCGGNGGQAND